MTFYFSSNKVTDMKKIILTLAFSAGIAIAAMAEKQTAYLYVPDMECNNCKGKVENVLAFEKGVRKLDFDVLKRLVTVVYEDKKTDVATLQAALQKHLNYKSEVLKSADETHEHHDHEHNHEGHNH